MKKVLKLVLFLSLLSFLTPICSAEDSKKLNFAEDKDLELSLKWMGLVSGKCVIKTEDTKTAGGNEAYLLKADLKTVALAELLFKLRANWNSLVNKSSLCPLEHQVSLEEEDYSYKEKVVFHHQEKKAERNGKSFKIPSDVRDPLSALLHLRSQEFKQGEILEVNIYDHKKIHKIKVKMVKKETINIYGQCFSTIVLEPQLEELELGGLASKIEKMSIYLSDDPKRLPLIIKATTTLGLVTALLENREELVGEKTDDREQKIEDR